MKVKFRTILKRLTGISTPVGGVSWNPPDSDRDIVRRLIAFLEDRRALYNPYDIEMPIYVDQSLVEIRRELTRLLQTIDDDSDVSPHLKAMRAACRKYLNTSSPRSAPRWGATEVERFAGLGELRAVFGIHIAQLAVKYGIDVERELASIFPPEDE